MVGVIGALAWVGSQRLFRSEEPPSPRPARQAPPAAARIARTSETADATEVRVPLSDAPAALRIVWIGDQRARVDACECHRNLRLRFAATLLRRLAAGPPRTVLLDAGGAVDGDSPLDRARLETYVAVLGDLGFAAIAVGAARGYLPPAGTDGGAPFLTIGGPPVRISLGARSLSFVCADSPPVPDMPGASRTSRPPRWTVPDAAAQAAAAIAPPRAQGDVVVLLGDLSRADAVRIATRPDAPDLILAARLVVAGDVVEDASKRVRFEDFLERVGRTSIFGISGSAFGAIRWLELAEDGLPTAYGFFNPAPTIAADPQVAARVGAFLRRVEAEPSLSTVLPRRFASEARENDATDGYLGTQACIRCHGKQGTQWRGTRHGGATKSLETIDRHYYPGCITCHSTGYGWPTGYRERTATAGLLRDVGCETCHGPGRRHSERPEEKGLVRRASSALCAECHDGREAKSLGDDLEKAYDQVRH